LSFTIYPAIDIKGGNCVRLLQGDYGKETVYGDSPFQMAKIFQQKGAKWIHIGDLDGAKDGKPVNRDAVIKCAKNLKVNIQVGGGIRTEADIVHYLENGINRVILGSVAITQPEFTAEMIRKYGETIVISVDVKDEYVAIDGWSNKSKLKAIEVGKAFADAGAETFIYTYIATNGTLAGPSFDTLEEFASEIPKNIIAAGGISTLDDLRGLKALAKKGISGAIVGKAFYENRISFKDALTIANSKKGLA
jgi:phosphoribosylformimino-5-aminoimidazole carboxamide ribotide isomerase